MFNYNVKTCDNAAHPDGGQNSNERVDRDSTVPLNLSADTADDKKAKRVANDAENKEMDRMKRVKCEQTEATDLSMKNTAIASQSRLNRMRQIATTAQDEINFKSVDPDRATYQCDKILRLKSHPFRQKLS